jgi:hypothetical protein
VPDEERVDTQSMPKTEAYTPTFDTGAHPQAEPEPVEPEPPAPRRRWWPARRRSSQPSTSEAPEAPSVSPAPAAETAAEPAAEAPPSGQLPTPAPPIAVPGRYHYLKWWQFLLTIIAVWVPAGAIGAGLFYWWSHDNSVHKTAVVFVVFVYVVVTTVAGLMLAMVPDRPLVSAVAVGVMSAVFASVVAAAPLYGAFYCEHSQLHCLMRVIPY